MDNFFGDLKKKVACELVEDQLEDALESQRGTPMGQVLQFTDSVGLDVGQVLQVADSAGCGVDDVIGAAEKIGLDGGDLCKLALKGKAGTLDAGDIIGAIGDQKKDDAVDGRDVLNFFTGQKKEEDKGPGLVGAVKGVFGGSEDDGAGLSLENLKKLF